MPKLTRRIQEVGMHYIDWSHRCFAQGTFNEMKHNHNHFVYSVLDDLGLDAVRTLQEYAPEVKEVDPNMHHLISGLATVQPWVLGNLLDKKADNARNIQLLQEEWSKDV